MREAVEMVRHCPDVISDIVRSALQVCACVCWGLGRSGTGRGRVGRGGWGGAEWAGVGRVG